MEKPQTSGGELVLPEEDPPVQAIKLFYGDRNDQRPSLGDVIGLACLELEPERVAPSVTRVNLAGEAAPASAQVPRPLYAARRLAKGWTRTWCCPARGVPCPGDRLRPLHLHSDSSLAPAEAAFIHRIPLAGLLGQCPPLGTGPGQPQDPRGDPAELFLRRIIEPPLAG